MSQWAEIRHLHLVEGEPKKEIARRLKLDVKTVRRAVERPTPPARVSSPRASSLDPWRDRIEQWLREDRKLMRESALLERAFGMRRTAATSLTCLLRQQSLCASVYGGFDSGLC